VGLRIVLALLAALAIVALVAGEGRSPPVAARAAAPLLAVDDGWLVRLDPRSLRPLGGGRVRLREPIEGWTRRGSHLAVVNGSKLRLFDVERMREIWELDTGARGSVAAIAWPRPDRVWVVRASPGCCATGTTGVVAVDTVKRRVVVLRTLASGLTRAAATPDGVVLLLAPSSTIGPATLATVDGDGGVERDLLDGVSAGLQPTEGVPFILRTRQPGLAVDAARRRAYVLSSRPQVVEVDLRTSRATYHRLSPHRSLLERLRDLLEPPADAQGEVGPVRTARWLQPALIAVSGLDSHVRWRSGGIVDRVLRPAGLQVIDVRRWEVRTLDERASGFRTADGLIVTAGDGLAVYEGGEALRLLEGRSLELLGAAGSLAYVREGRRLHVVDLVAGRILTTVERPPLLLLEPAPSPWG
jgi:hypothetical protein